jgi:hypothetical protein
MSLNHRLQILLDEERFERITEAARQQRVSVAAIIRDAIDRSLAPVDRRRSKAGEHILEAAPMDVPAGDELLVELDGLRGRR